jgi:flavin-dependent dehydrogenase
MCDGGKIHTNLVVDATGRSSDTATKLAEHNLPKPRLLCVNPNVASASRMVKMPKDFEKNHDWLLLVCKTQPNGNRGGTLLPTEYGRWQVTLAEVGGDGPENTDEGFLEFAKSLPDQTMYNILKQCEPLTPGNTIFSTLFLSWSYRFLSHSYRFLSHSYLFLSSAVMKYLAMRNEMVCYHEIDMPRGLLAVGDSVMRLNALYGQGIAVSSQSVVLLEQTLTRAFKDAQSDFDRKQALNTLGATFQPLLAKHLMPAWNLATKADLKYPTTTSNVPLDPPSSTDKLITDTLLTAAQSNVVVYHRLLEVAHLTAPPSKLFTDARTWVPLMCT